MTRQIRELAAQGLIGIAICIGGYFMFVAPVREDLARIAVRMAEAEQAIREYDLLRDRIAIITDELKRAEEQAGMIEQSGRMARDHRELFAGVMRLAAAHGARVDQITPVQAAAARPSLRTAGGQETNGDVTVGYRMTVVAAYGELGEFLGALRGQLGYTSVRSVRIVPADDHGESVHATIETEHFFFDPAPVDGGDADIRSAGVQEGHR
jgi:hypothetical protein